MQSSAHLSASARRWSGLVVLALVCVLSAELVARVDDYLRYGIPLSAVPDEGRDLTLRDSLGVRGRPHGRYRWWHLNAYGFRAPEMTPTPRPGCVRIVILGASETFGLYESPDMDYPAQLRSELAARGCYEVVNAAIPGASLRSMLVLWRRWVSPFQPQIVVIYPNPSFYLSVEAPGTPERSGESRRPRAEKPPPWWTPRLIDRAHRAFHYPDVVQRRRLAHWLAADLAGRDSTWLFDRVPTDRLAGFESDLDSLVLAIRVDDVEPILVTHAMPFTRQPRSSDADLLQAWRHYYPRATTETLLAFDSAAAESTRRIGEQQGVAVVDAAAELGGRSTYFVDFTHFTDRGARAVADLLSTRILSDPVGSPDTGAVARAGAANSPATSSAPASAGRAKGGRGQ
jgi:hypothetical protein